MLCEDIQINCEKPSRTGQARTLRRLLKRKNSFKTLRAIINTHKCAAVPRIELRLKVLKTSVLPLDHTAKDDTLS